MKVLLDLRWVVVRAQKAHWSVDGRFSLLLQADMAVNSNMINCFDARASLKHLRERSLPTACVQLLNSSMFIAPKHCPSLVFPRARMMILARGLRDHFPRW